MSKIVSKCLGCKHYKHIEEDYEMPITTNSGGKTGPVDLTRHLCNGFKYDWILGVVANEKGDMVPDVKECTGFEAKG